MLAEQRCRFDFGRDVIKVRRSSEQRHLALIICGIPRVPRTSSVADRTRPIWGSSASFALSPSSTETAPARRAFCGLTTRKHLETLGIDDIICR